MCWIQKIGRTDISKEAENDGNHIIKSDFLAAKTACFENSQCSLFVKGQ
jgi:hypothetical protein